MSTMTAPCERFQVTVHISPGSTCGTSSILWLNLIGSEGETLPLAVNEDRSLQELGSVCQVLVQALAPLGRLLLVRLRLEALAGSHDSEGSWRCSRVEVRRLQGAEPEEHQVQVFLCDRWLRTQDGGVELRSGKMCLLKEETEEKLRQHRLKQLQRHQETFRWRQFVVGAPQCLDANRVSELGPNLSYTHKSPPVDLSYLRSFPGRLNTWSSFKDLETLFAGTGEENAIARFVKEHWREDWFFGHQSLNGCNPLLLRQIRLLPPHLSVTADMLRPFLPLGSSLHQELQEGNIYLLDYEVLDGVPANVVNGRQTYLCAPLCLLHLNQQGELLPIAIQLQQTPGPLTPVFLPSDPGSDWLLAKTWVRCADFQLHQVASHYLRTHMMGELCCVATLRQLPDVHPLHPLLMSHVKTTLQINLQARASLLAVGGVFDQAMGSGLEALPVILSRASSRMTFRSLCVPDDLSDRGVDKLPHSFYARDALRVWDTLHRFVCSWLDVFYSGDVDVQQDSELQLWIQDFTAHGFTCGSGFPRSFQSKAEVSQFVTAMLFCCSALHAAINFSQLDFGLWMPNCPAAMLRPPPQVKAAVTEDDIITYLPEVSSTCRVLTVLTLLSQPAVDFVPLCHYRDAVFRDSALLRLVEEVQAELKLISKEITDRNVLLELPYPYLCPDRIDNSVAI